jgi:hypothetical protein
MTRVGSCGVVQEDVDRAAEMIEDLLQPQDETRMEHKRMQLRELAALNGTLKDEDVSPPSMYHSPSLLSSFVVVFLLSLCVTELRDRVNSSAFGRELNEVIRHDAPTTTARLTVNSFRL